MEEGVKEPSFVVVVVADASEIPVLMAEATMPTKFTLVLGLELEELVGRKDIGIVLGAAFPEPATVLTDELPDGMVRSEAAMMIAEMSLPKELELLAMSPNDVEATGEQISCSKRQGRDCCMNGIHGAGETFGGIENVAGQPWFLSYTLA
jgi:hypothetical protein